MGSTLIAGFAAGIIVALAIMVGLSTGSETQLVVVNGIVIVALVEGFSDAFSEYLSTRTEKTHAIRTVWKEAAVLFTTKFFIILHFIIPFMIFPNLVDATYFAIFWGLFIISIMSGYIAKQQENKRVIRTMALYVTAAIIIVTITYFAGDLVEHLFRFLGII